MVFFLWIASSKFHGKFWYIYFVGEIVNGVLRGGGLGSRPIFKKFNETYAPS